MKAIIERVEADKVSEELSRRGFAPGQTVRVTVETVDSGERDLNGLLQAVHELSEEAQRNGLTDEALEEILRADRKGS